MPRVYLTKEDKREREISDMLKQLSSGKQDALAKVWGISQQGVSHRLKNGNITLIDLYRAREIINLDLRKLNYLLGED